jgi:hypothetical protein
LWSKLREGLKCAEEHPEYIHLQSRVPDIRKKLAAMEG